MPLDGTLPPWLDGIFLHVGPGKLEVGGRRVRSWIDGFAMFSRFSFAGGRVAYANRFLASEAYRSATDRGELTLREFATDPPRPLRKRLASLVRPDLTDNASHNVVRIGAYVVALAGASPRAHRVDPRTLETSGGAFDVSAQLITPHPRLDPTTGRLVNWGIRFGPRNTYRVLTHNADGTSDVIASIPTREPAWFHDFGMTERYVVVPEIPYVVNPLQVPLGTGTVADSFQWKPERPARFLVIDRRNGSLRARYETDPFFVFHVANAYEEGDDIAVDLIAYTDPSIIGALELEALDVSPPRIDARLRRYRLSLNGGSVRSEELSAERQLEAPRIDDRVSGRAYRYVWAGAGTPDESNRLLGRIVKVDVERRETVAQWSEGECSTWEPVFVPAPDGRDEDDGVILSLALDPGRGRSILLVLDARTLADVARVELPHVVPFGFHGRYFGDVV